MLQQVTIQLVAGRLLKGIFACDLTDTFPNSQCRPGLCSWPMHSDFVVQRPQRDKNPEQTCTGIRERLAQGQIMLDARMPDPQYTGCQAAVSFPQIIEIRIGAW